MFDAPNLTQILGSSLEEALGDWPLEGEARPTARLSRYLGTRSCCCMPEAELPSSTRINKRVVRGACPLEVAGPTRTLYEVGNGEQEVFLCLAHSIAPAGIAFLRVGFSAPPTLSDLTKLAWGLGCLLNRDEPAEEGQGLRRRLSELEGAQEAEREWLALEVHDRIAQTLASVFQQLQAIESVARSSPEVRSLAVRASVLCREAIREARNIMKELRPPVLDELGFVPVMEEELRHLEEESGHQIKLGLACEIRPPRGIEMVLYRVFHEAITNIRKHAGASEVAVSMKSDQSAVLLQIEDNGVGFDVGEVLRKKRIGGLVSMQRRAQVAGGTCRIERLPSQGTRVSLWLPYDTEQAP